MNGVPETREGKPLPEGGGLAFSRDEKLAERELVNRAVFARLKNHVQSVSVFRNLNETWTTIAVQRGMTVYSWPGFSEFLFGSEGWHSVFWTFGRLIPEFAEIAKRQPGSVQELELLMVSLGMAA